MKIVAFNPNEKRYEKLFIQFPFTLYKNTPQWVPPLVSDTKYWFDTKKNPFYHSGEARFFLAMNENEHVLGRLAMLENQHYNDYFNIKAAFFYLFECVDDFSIAESLFRAGFNWARERSLNQVIGPKGFSVLDGYGTLIEGAHQRASYGQVYNPPYYQNLIEDMGFTKRWDTMTGYMERKKQLPEKIFQVAELIQKKRGFRVRLFKTKSELKAIIPDVKHLYNQSLAEDSRNIPVSDEEMRVLAKQLIRFADPQLVKIIYKGDQAVGFMLAYPNISAALQKTGGKLFLFGWITLLYGLKHADSVTLNGAGILKEYQRLGGTALLYAEMYKSIMANPNYQYGEFLQVRDDNTNMRLEWENVGIDLLRVHRLYQINL